MVAAQINSRTNANRTLRRFQSAGELLRLGMGNSIAFQITPGGSDRTEPVFHLRDDETAELLVGELLSAEHGGGDQRFSSGSVRRCDLADHREIIDGAGAIAV